jgi:hypothetical protein
LNHQIKNEQENLIISVKSGERKGCGIALPSSDQARLSFFIGFVKLDNLTPLVFSSFVQEL